MFREITKLRNANFEACNFPTPSDQDLGLLNWRKQCSLSRFIFSVVGQIASSVDPFSRSLGQSDH